MKVGIVMDAWKLPIFQRHLDAAEISYARASDAPPGSIGLVVITDDPQRVAEIVTAANTEAAITKRGAPDAN